MSTLADSSARIQFKVNGTDIVVGDDVDVDTRLSTFLRDHLHLTGTKVSCTQGGCGACTVTVNSRDSESGMVRARATYSVRSIVVFESSMLESLLEIKMFSFFQCLVSLVSCDGWDISTIEHLGNTKDGLHPLQVFLTTHDD